jgi:genome maintenance exonuclease 1|tara:strand:- start:375 stop:1064 length:690 start_codon:yes stop_codon:yes gene_type:complete
MPKIIKQYPYQEFKRTSVDGKRLYQNPWGDPVPSVTTILSDTQPAEKRAGLAAWRKRVGKEEAQRITTTAANRGTVMHNILEHWALGEYETYNPGNNIVHQQAKAMAQVVVDNIENDVDEIWGTEVNLVAKELYAGTTDLVGVYKGEATIMDFKQTNKPKKREWIDDYFLQGAAYANAHNEMYGTDISRIAIFMCSGDCQWQLFESGPEDFKDWEMKWAQRLEKFYRLS